MVFAMYHTGEKRYAALKTDKKHARSNVQFPYAIVRYCIGGLFYIKAEMLYKYSHYVLHFLYMPGQNSIISLKCHLSYGTNLLESFYRNLLLFPLAHDTLAVN